VKKGCPVPVTYQYSREIPVADLTCFEGNPRRGNVKAIATSLYWNGQYRAIVVRDTGGGLVILAGNHTCEALTLLYSGWLPPDAAPGTAWSGRREVARCDVITCTDDEARRIVAADNRTGELGTYDDQVLADLLAQIADDDTGLGYAGTGWEDITIPDEDDDAGAGAADGREGQGSDGPPGSPEAPDAFPAFDDDIDTTYQCPRCTYQWSGKPK